MASCSGAAFWGPSFPPVGLLIHRVGTVISTPGIVRIKLAPDVTSAGLPCAGSWAFAVWLYSPVNDLGVLPIAPHDPGLCSSCLRRRRRASTCTKETGQQVSGFEGHEESSPSSIRAPLHGPLPFRPLTHRSSWRIPPSDLICQHRQAHPLPSLSSFLSLCPFKLLMRLHHPGLQVGCEWSTQALGCLFFVGLYFFFFC